MTRLNYCFKLFYNECSIIWFCLQYICALILSYTNIQTDRSLTTIVVSGWVIGSKCLYCLPTSNNTHPDQSRNCVFVIMCVCVFLLWYTVVEMCFNSNKDNHDQNNKSSMIIIITKETQRPWCQHQLYLWRPLHIRLTITITWPPPTRTTTTKKIIES